MEGKVDGSLTIARETRQIPNGKELFPRTNPRSQLNACYSTLRNVLTEYGKPGHTISPDETEVLDQYSQLVKRSENDTVLRTDPYFSQRVIRATVSLLDLTVADSIKPSAIVTEKGKASYLRESGYFDANQDLPLPQVPDSVRENHVEEDFHHFPIFLSANEFQRAGFDPSQVESFDELQQKLNDPAASQQPQYFRLSDEIYGVSMPSDAWSDKAKDVQKRLYPLSEIPRQEVWKAFLENGQPLFPQENPQENNDTSVPPEGNSPSDRQDLLDEERGFLSVIQTLLPKDEKWKAILRRKNRVWVNGSEQDEKLEDYLARHKEHYARVLGHEHPLFGSPDVFFTRSGVSANGAVIQAIHEYVNADSAKVQELKSYAMDGFYYENEGDIHQKFPNGTFDDASIFFVNYDPSFAGTQFPEGYEKAREEFITRVKEKAAQSADQSYFLVCDKTANPLYETFKERETLPPNLQIFETASITKHQRGGRNYFFGSVFHWGDKEVAPLIDKAIVDTRGTLTPLGIIHLPRLTKGELQQSIDHAKLLGTSAEVILEELQKGVPEDQRWKLENYTFYGYLTPPKDQQGSFDLSKNLNTVADNDSEDSVEHGDSFGLDHTRLAVVPVFSKWENRDNSVKHLRIAYGMATTPQQIQNFIHKGFEAKAA